MQYAARNALEDTVDEDFIVANTLKVVSDYPDDMPSSVLTGLVVERIEGYLNHEYSVWCAANEEEPADQFTEEITDIVGQYSKPIESTIEELHSQMDEADNEPDGYDTEVFDT